MNEDTLNIIVCQKRDIEKLNEYVDAGFKVICDWGKKDHKSINILSFTVGVLIFSVIHQNSKIKKLEKKIDKLCKDNQVVEIEKDNDPLEKVSAE